MQGICLNKYLTQFPNNQLCYLSLAFHTGESSTVAEMKKKVFLEKRCAVVSAQEMLLKIFGDQAKVPATNLRELEELEKILAEGIPEETLGQIVQRRNDYVSVLVQSLKAAVDLMFNVT
jgi:hypothetical protein